jgi:integrase/recombinase XerD
MAKARQRKETEIIYSVQDAVKDFLASAEVKSLAKSTKDEYTYVLGVFAKWCGEHSIVQNRDHRTWSAPLADEDHPPIFLSRVNDQVVSLFLGYLQATHKPSRKDSTELSSATLVLFVKDIKRLLNWCLMDDLYSKHVMARTVSKIKKPELQETIKPTFSDEQIDALFGACKKEVSEHLRMRDKAILSVLLDSGLRVTELCTLTIGNVFLDPKDAYVRILGKGPNGGKWGEVGMGDKARKAVQKYIRQFREPTIEYELEQDDKYRLLSEREKQKRKRQYINQQCLIVSRTCEPLSRGGLLQLIVRLGEWAGIPEDQACHPHIFRHTFSRLFMENGGDIYVLSRLLRHTSVKVTELYLKSLGLSFARKNAKSVLDSL